MDNLAFYLRRLTIPFMIIALSSIFPNVNIILSLLGGSICGVCFIILPIFFYRQAYIIKPSKKSRCWQMSLGYLIVLLTVPVGIMGVYMNVQKLLISSEDHEFTVTKQ